MAEGLQRVRTKTVAIDDPDPTVVAFTPPEGEIFKVSTVAKGFRLGLVFTGGTAFTATVRIYARDATTGTWFRSGVRPLVANRTLFIQCDTGAHDIWPGLTAITGGVPILVWMEEID